jgi:UDP-glucose 4-epimerase
MRVLVTGVAGFLGSNLALELLRRGYEVVGVDNMSHGDKLNLVGLVGHSRFAMHYVDIQDATAMKAAAEGCGLVVHLAALKIPRYTDGLDTLLTNTMGTDAVLKAALEQGAKVVAASTSDVYGKNTSLPFHEDSALVMGSPDVRRWAYAISKMFEEQIMFAYHDRYGMNVVPLRFFGGYGPNQNLTWWGGPQAVFINKALDGEELEIHGDGTQTRTFTYVSDHVDGIMRALENPAANNLVFNIGHHREISIRDLAAMVWRLVRCEDDAPRMRLVPYETFGKYEDVKRRVPDTTRARDLIGFRAVVDLEDGLRRTIAWQVKRRRDQGIPTPHEPTWLD